MTGAGPAILLLAAGASARMGGRDKLMEQVGGVALIAERAAAACATGAPVLVALPPRDAAPARWEALDGLDLRRVPVGDAAKGMAASLKAGLAALPRATPGVMIVLADMPDISSADMRALLEAFDGATILRGAGADGAPGHPVLFPARDFATLASLTGDTGARAFLQHESGRVRLIRLPGAHALTDLDTPQDWTRWRAAAEPR